MIGPWAMLDVFLLAVLVSLVKLEQIATIHPRYSNLVRSGTKFWDVSGIDVRGGLFRGVEINVESLRSLVAGGIAFATPNNPKDTPAMAPRSRRG